MPVLPGTSSEPTATSTNQASSFRLQYFPYYYLYYHHHDQANHFYSHSLPDAFLLLASAVQYVLCVITRCHLDCLQLLSRYIIV